MMALYCGGCGFAMVTGDHSRCLGAGKPASQRRTYADKLERVSEITSDMMREAAQTQNREVMEALARWGEKINRALEGEWG